MYVNKQKLNKVDVACDLYPEELQILSYINSCTLNWLFKVSHWIRTEFYDRNCSVHAIFPYKILIALNIVHAVLKLLVNPQHNVVTLHNSEKKNFIQHSHRILHTQETSLVN